MIKKTLIVIFFLVILGTVSVNSYLNKLDKIVISDVDLTKITNGIYNGSYKNLLVGAEVSVAVKDNRMSNIILVKHSYGKGKPAEQIIDRVLERQSLKVDVISGATYSSKAILKAIETALTQ